MDLRHKPVQVFIRTPSGSLLDGNQQFPAFPHEPTSDQFFSAEQFDAYRRLGQHQIRTIFGGPKGTTYHIGDLFDLADEHTKIEQKPDLASTVTTAVVKAMNEAVAVASTQIPEQALPPLSGQDG